MITNQAMSKTIYFETLPALLAYAVEAFSDYSGPFPDWAVGSERKCAAVYAKRAAFGLSGVDQLQLEDYTANMDLLDSMGAKLYAAAVADAGARAENAVALQDGPSYVSHEEHVTAMQESGQWPADEDSEHWHFAAIRELIYQALTK
jgi:hypothetical protein